MVLFGDPKKFVTPVLLLGTLHSKMVSGKNWKPHHKSFLGSPLKEFLSMENQFIGWFSWHLRVGENHDQLCAILNRLKMYSQNV